MYSINDKSSASYFLIFKDNELFTKIGKSTNTLENVMQYFDTDKVFAYKYIGSVEKLLNHGYVANMSNSYLFKSMHDAVNYKNCGTIFIDSKTKDISFSGTVEYCKKLLAELGEDVTHCE